MTRASASAVAGFVALYIAIGALSPYLPIYYGSLGLGLDAIGLLSALYAATAMVGAPLWGLAADRFAARRPILTLAASGAAVAAAALAVVTGTLLIALAAVALAVAMSGIMPILDAHALEVTGGRSDYARLRVWGSASFIVAVMLTGWVTEGMGPAGMFAVLVPALAACAGVGLAIRSRPTTAPLERLTAVRSVLAHRTLVRFLMVVLITWTSSTTINAFYSIHLVDVGAPQWLVGIAWAVGATVEVPLMVAFPFLVRRIGLEWLLRIGAVLFVLRAVAVVVTRDPLIVGLSMIFHGGAFALFLVGGTLYVSRHAPPGAAATAQGMLVAIVFGLAQVVGPSLGGLVAAEIGLRVTFVIAGFGSVAAVVALGWLLAQPSSRDAPAG